MNYRQCIAIVNDNLHLVGRYLDGEKQLVEEPKKTNLVIREVIVAPPIVGMGIFKDRHSKSRKFNEAISAWLSNADLRVVFYAEDLGTGLFDFINYIP